MNQHEGIYLHNINDYPLVVPSWGTLNIPDLKESDGMKTKAIITIMLTLFLVATMFSLQATTVPSIAWLPPLANQDLFQLKDGSTLPIKFSLLNPDGSFVRDKAVRVDVNKVIFSDNFNGETTGENPSKWNVREPDNTDVLIDENVYYGTGGKSAKLIDNSLTGRPDILISFTPQSGKFIYQVSVQLAQNNAIDTFLYISEGDGVPPGTIETNAVCIVFWSDGYIKYNDGGTWINIQTYSADTWYTARAVVDVPTQTYDLYINGELKTSGAAFRYTHWKLDTIFATTTVPAASVMWVDNVLVLEADPIKTFTYGEGDDNVRIGTVLSDDFEDEDFTNNPTWTIDYTHSGDPTGEKKQFSAPTLMTDHTYYFEGQTATYPLTGVLYTSNPTNVGSWQFDSKLISPDDQYNLLILGEDHSFWDGPLYRIVHSYNNGNPLICFQRCDGWGIFTTLIDAGTGYPLGWHTIMLTRDSSGTWELFIDGISKGTAVDNTYTELNYIGLGRYGGFDNILVQECYYIANLHTKENGMDTGDYAITVWFEGTFPIKDTYLFELTDNIQGYGRGKGRA